MKRRQMFRRLIVVTMLIAFVAVGAAGLSGCGSKRSPYPEAKVKSSLGRPSTCAFCKKVIAIVEQDNLITVKGVEYIVCDDKCAAALAQWARSQ